MKKHHISSSPSSSANYQIGAENETKNIQRQQISSIQRRETAQMLIELEKMK